MTATILTLKEMLRLSFPEAMEDIDLVVHMAAIVGAPACKKYPELAKKVNYGGTVNINKIRKNREC